jgi:ribosomal protein S19E (S16A)
MPILNLTFGEKSSCGKMILLKKSWLRAKDRGAERQKRLKTAKTIIRKILEQFKKSF